MDIMNTFCTQSLSAVERNIEKIKVNYKLYTQYKEKSEAEEKIIKDFLSREDSKYLIDILNNFISECHRKGMYFEDNESAQRFLKEHPELDDFRRADDRECEWARRMAEAQCFIFNEYIELVLLNKNNRRYILDLKEQEMLDVDKYDKDLADFIVDSLKKMNCMYEIEQQDLPLLMAIKDDMNYYPDLRHIEKSCRSEERYYILSGISLNIHREYVRAKMIEQNVTEMDGIKGNIPFIYDEDKQEEIWKDFENTEFGEDEFWIEYYKKLILFGENIEELFKNTPQERKKYVIDAYHYYSSTYGDEHFRIPSPLINEEVLKRRYVKKR